MSSKNKHFSENDRVFYSDGYRLAWSAIEKGLNERTLFQAIEELYQAIDGLNESVIAFGERQKIKVACFKGCHWCCHQPVFANSYELHYLSAKIKETFSLSEVSDIVKIADDKFAVSSKLSEKELLIYKSPCPLLADGSCRIYRARPMACRIYLSYEFRSCLEFFNHPDDGAGFPALLDFPLRAGRMMNEGFMAALKVNGTSTAEFKLEEGLLIMLKNKL